MRPPPLYLDFAATTPVDQIVGMGEAYRLARQERDAERERAASLRDRLGAGPRASRRTRPQLAHSSIRFSLGRFTTAEEIDAVVESVTSIVARLRAMSPLSDLHRNGVDFRTVHWAAQ